MAEIREVWGEKNMPNLTLGSGEGAAGSPRPSGRDAIELVTTAGGTGDASDLTAFLTFVSES